MISGYESASFIMLVCIWIMLMVIWITVMRR
jgi:hypothetical protein